MPNIIDYKLVVAASFQELEEKVKKNMNQGWTIWGSLNIMPDETRVRKSVAAQVMVKFVKEN